jgi:methyl-accepting chemotaxis protein
MKTKNQLLQYEQELAQRLRELSKNASQNFSKMERVSLEIKDVQKQIVQIDEATAEAAERVKRPYVEDLEKQQAKLADEARELSKHGSRHVERIAELGREMKQIDQTIAEVQNVEVPEK